VTKKQLTATAVSRTHASSTVH